MGRKGVKKWEKLEISVPIVYIVYLERLAIYSVINKLWPGFNG